MHPNLMVHVNPLWSCITLVPLMRIQSGQAPVTCRSMTRASILPTQWTAKPLLNCRNDNTWVCLFPVSCVASQFFFFFFLSWLKNTWQPVRLCLRRKPREDVLLGESKRYRTLDPAAQRLLFSLLLFHGKHCRAPSIKKVQKGKITVWRRKKLLLHWES